MRIFCMADIHGFIAEFEEALSMVMEHLKEDDTRLFHLGDYIHGGGYDYEVIDKIMELQESFGTDKVVALLGNHEEFVLLGDSTISQMIRTFDKNLDADNADDDKYIRWMDNLPYYRVEGHTIFCHAGIDEEAGELWEWGTGEHIFTSKYPAEVGEIEGLDMIVVAGHVGTAEISGDPGFHDIYYDGKSHIFLDGTVWKSGKIPVLMVETGDDKDKYYRVTENGLYLLEPYAEWNI